MGWGPNYSWLVYRGGIATAAALLTLYVLAALVPSAKKENSKTIGLSAGFATLASGIVLVCFPDQNSDAFYLHDVAAAVFVAAQPVTSLALTAALDDERRHVAIRALHYLSAAIVVTFSLAVAAFLIPLFARYNLYTLYLVLSGLSPGERKPLLDGIAGIAWWFPVSELGLIASTYVWYLVTAAIPARND